MKLLILDGPRDPHAADCPPYRGTYRAHPTYCDAFSEHDEINKLFFWFLESGGELGVVGDLTKAVRFAELWNTQLGGKESFEVLEATDDNSNPERGVTLVGFDLSAGYNSSLLWCGLKSGTGLASLSPPVRDRWESLRQTYIPELNQNGLFQTLEAASDCRRSMIALQDLSPNFFEGGDLRRFLVTGLYLPPLRQ